ncbi:NAD(P)/FAD-dependent oxidoreductase [Cellulomonas dongxiuzhuiae]|uniref:FAD-binding oxidoreductase n=1 Tax=Cellulomonas dongxiuzhuiae TaxID=2819979 RepID=A0ABX8GKK9_9CELL|nr:FAD-dependent oxidoreductase [Cellulomonas dongxiuzhuiae]MBO3095058.1 FAD-dependent oxidoreductase [Cellulomonas dongxiuzhuiae]QWC16071.1 FAD-binding oxidoreductase [Cellulomonas dongxiuzhuiae]
MAEPVDVAVVGDGVVGAFVVAALLDAGVPAVRLAWFGDRGGYERRSATRRSGGLLRCGVAEGPAARLAVESFTQTWRQHPDRVVSGAVEVVGRDRSALLLPRVEELAAAGVAGDLVTTDRLRKAIPFAWDDGDVALLEPGGGWAPPHAVRSRLVRAACRAGVALRDVRPVDAVEHDAPGPVRVRTGAETVRARCVVVAAGRSTHRLVPSVPGTSRLRRIGYAYYDGLLPPGLPAVNDEARGLWWRPAPTRTHPARYLVGRAVDAPSDGVTSVGRSVQQDEYVRAGFAALLPDAGRGTYLGGVTSFDVQSDGHASSTPWHAAADGNVLAVHGLDGGGFKQAPAIARRLAAAVMKEETS